jgi:hypothetical protein
MKRIYVSLTTRGSIDKAIKELENYKITLLAKIEIFLNRLAEKGIETAMSTSGEWGKFIIFRQEVNTVGDDVECLVIATDGQKVLKEWYPSKKDAQNGTNERSYFVSPLLMAEFGSGWLADVMYNIAGVGQGTMPNSYGHAADPDGWYWYDKSGTKHHSVGEPPKYPMHNAMVRMMNEIESTAKEVFKQ